MNTTNTRRIFLKSSLLGLSATGLSSAGFAKTAKKLPKILLIGDSVSIGYTNYIVGIMMKRANILRPLNSGGGYLNCEGTTSGVKNIDAWLGDVEWDVIHFNFGLHDLKHVLPGTTKNSMDSNHPQQANLEQYEKNLNVIVEKLKATKAKLVFATTTPFPDKPGGPLRRADQPAKYNAVAKRIMKRNGIAINDLHDFVLPRMKELMPPKNVHFNEAGSLELAQQVISHIEKALSR